MSIFSNIAIVKKFINIFNSGNDINLSGFSDSEKSILISAINNKLNKKSIVIASDLISASNLENMFLALDLKVEVLKETANTVQADIDWQKQEKEEIKKKEISKKVLNFCKGGADVLIILPSCLNQNVSGLEQALNSELSAVAEAKKEFGIDVYSVVTMDDIIAAIEKGVIDGREHLSAMYKYRNTYGAN